MSEEQQVELKLQQGLFLDGAVPQLLPGCCCSVRAGGSTLETRGASSTCTTCWMQTFVVLTPGTLVWVWGLNSAQISAAATSVMVFSNSAAKHSSHFARMSLVKQCLTFSWIDRTMSSLMEQEKLTWQSTGGRAAETQSSPHSSSMAYVIICKSFLNPIQTKNLMNNNKNKLIHKKCSN